MTRYWLLKGSHKAKQVGFESRPDLIGFLLTVICRHQPDDHNPSNKSSTSPLDLDLISPDYLVQNVINLLLCPAGRVNACILLCAFSPQAHLRLTEEN